MEMLEAELLYWFYVVQNYLEAQEDWRYLGDATVALLKGTHNQQYISDEILYPVMRWRQLDDALAADILRGSNDAPV